METLNYGYPAFYAWFKANYEHNLHAGAQCLHGFAVDGAPDNIVWPLLKATGDAVYTSTTFIKAAQIAIERGE